MNLMQTNLQQAYKDYLDLRNYISEDSKTLDTQRKEAHEKAIELETLQEQASYFFENFGYKDILRIDLMEAQKKLYYYYEAYKDLIDIPDEIKEELKDYSVKSVFAIKDGKKEIIDKDLYNTYRKKHQEYAEEIAKYQQEA